MIQQHIARVAEETVLNLKELETRIEVLKNDLAALCTTIGHPEAARIAVTPAAWLGPNVRGLSGNLGVGSPFGTISPYGNLSPVGIQQGISPLGLQQQGVAPFGISAYASPYASAYNTPFATPFGTPFASPFASYASPWAAGINAPVNPYGSSFASPLGSPLAQASFASPVFGAFR